MDPRLDFALELERRDATVGKRLEVLAALAREVDRVRARAEQLLAFFERLPAERADVDAAAAESEGALERAHERRAQIQAAQTGDDPATAERELAAADASVRAVEERLERTAAQRAALARQVDDSQAEARALAQASRAAAGELEQEPRVTLAAVPGPGLGDVLDWAARAHAAILVARSGLDAERDRISREANELGSSVLGEALQATDVSLVRRRVEERLGGRA